MDSFAVALAAFIGGRLLTKSFWMLVAATFFGVLFLQMRNFYRNENFLAAVEAAKKVRFNGVRF